MYSEQNFEDKHLRCADCGEQFLFSADDQAFFAQKRYSEPKRCPVCRANRKLSDSGSRGGFNGGRRNSYNKPQYEVVCSACGVQTTVPFEPSNDKPVYCSQCYRNRY